MKQVILPKMETISIKDVHSMHLYAFKSTMGEVFKLQAFEGGYTFVDLDSSCIHTEICDTLEEAISNQLDEGETVYEFITFEEFVEWLNDEV